MNMCFRVLFCPALDKWLETLPPFYIFSCMALLRGFLNKTFGCTLPWHLVWKSTTVDYR